MRKNGKQCFSSTWEKNEDFFVWGWFLSVSFFSWFPVLASFVAICSILNLEVTIYTVFAAFWTSNPSLSIIFGSLSWNLQHFGAGSCHFSGFDFTWLFHSFHWFFHSFHWFLHGFHLFFWSFDWFLEIHDDRCANYKCRCIEVYMRDQSGLCANVDKCI